MLKTLLNNTYLHNIVILILHDIIILILCLCCRWGNRILITYARINWWVEDQRFYYKSLLKYSLVQFYFMTALFNFYYIYLLIFFICVGVCVCHGVYVEVREQLQEWPLSAHHVGSTDWAQVSSFRQVTVP